MKLWQRSGLSRVGRLREGSAEAARRKIEVGLKLICRPRRYETRGRPTRERETRNSHRNCANLAQMDYPIGQSCVLHFLPGSGSS